MKKIVKTLIASVAAVLLLLSCAHISDFVKQENVSSFTSEGLTLCYNEDDWEYA